MALSPGTYVVEFWSGDVLINSVQITVDGTISPEVQPEVPAGQGLPLPPLFAIVAIVLVSLIPVDAFRKKK
jgi:hypothetical protein